MLITTIFKTASRQRIINLKIPMLMIHGQLDRVFAIREEESLARAYNGEFFFSYWRIP